MSDGGVKEFLCSLAVSLTALLPLSSVTAFSKLKFDMMVYFFSDRPGRLLLFFAWSIVSCHPVISPTKDHPTYFDSLFSRADSIDPDHKDRAFAYVDSVYAALPDAGPDDLYRKYDYMRHYFYETRKDFATAMVYADSALETVDGKAGQTLYAEDYGRALFSKADILMAEGKSTDAFVYYYRGRLAIGQTNDSCLLGEYNGRLGAACYHQGLFREAMTYFREAFGEAAYCAGRDSWRQFVYQQGNLDNIALCYAKMGKPDSAGYYYDSVLSYVRQNEDRFIDRGSDRRFVETAKGVIYGNEGEIRERKGDRAAAESLYKASIAINSQKEHANQDARITRAKLIRLYLSARRFAEANEELNFLRLSLDSWPDKEVELRWLQLEGNYNDSIRRPAEALAYVREYMLLKDSLDRREAPVDVTGELNRLQQEYELKLLRNQDEAKTGYLVISILLCSMAVIIIGLVAGNWRSSKKNVTRLTLLNQGIQTQNDHRQKALNALEQSQRDNSRLMKVVAHDLRNPVGGIEGIVCLLLKIPDWPKDQRQMLELIQTSSRSALGLINELLQAHTTTEMMRMDPVDIEAALKYCVQLLQFKAAAKEQRIVLHTIPMIARADREKIWRVLSNLVTNAIKFSPSGAEITVGMERAGDWLTVWVKDQGIGIPEEMRERLFDLFTPARRKGTAGEESFGLGLGISRQIVAAHGGKMWFETEVGKGTTFYVELPITG